MSSFSIGYPGMIYVANPGAVVPAAASGRSVRAAGEVYHVVQREYRPSARDTVFRIIAVVSSEADARKLL